jgi:hypothetical protein
MSVALPTKTSESSVFPDLPFPAAPGSRGSDLLRHRRRVESTLLRRLAAERFLAADQASSVGRPVYFVAPQADSRPTDWTEGSPAHVLGGNLALSLRAEVTNFLRSANLSYVLEELDAIEERLVTDKPVARKHAADSMRRVLVAVADHVFPACTEPYRDRWGNSHGVGADQPVNRILAFVDTQRVLTTVEQKALAGELLAMWRSASLEVHGSTTLGDAKGDYLRLLKGVAVVSAAHLFDWSLGRCGYITSSEANNAAAAVGSVPDANKADAISTAIRAAPGGVGKEVLNLPSQSPSKTATRQRGETAIRRPF